LRTTDMTFSRFFIVLLKNRNQIYMLNNVFKEKQKGQSENIINYLI